MLKKIRTAVAVITMLALGACNSVTAPQGQVENQNDQGKHKNDERPQVSVDDEFTPDRDGGGGAGPGERDNEDERGRKRNPDDWTPNDGGSSGPDRIGNIQLQEDNEWTLYA